MSNITVNIKRLDPTVELPKYAHPTDAGLDLRSNEDCVLKPFERRLVSTGLAIALPDGYAGFVQPRSGLAIKQGLSIVNTPGLIDAHYRGELKVILINLDPSHRQADIKTLADMRGLSSPVEAAEGSFALLGFAYELHGCDGDIFGCVRAA